MVPPAALTAGSGVGVAQLVSSEVTLSGGPAVIRLPSGMRWGRGLAAANQPTQERRRWERLHPKRSGVPTVRLRSNRGHWKR